MTAINIQTFNPQPRDFYAYSCGGWERSNPIPDGKTGWSMFEKLTEANQLVMKNALDRAREERRQRPDAAPDKARQKLLAYYEACLDLNGTVEDREGRPLVNLLRDPRVRGWKVAEMATDEEVLPDVVDRARSVCIA